MCLGNGGKTNLIVCSVCLCWDHASFMQIDAKVHFLQTQYITSVLTGRSHVLVSHCLSTTDLLLRNTITYRHFAAISKHVKSTLFYFGALQPIQLMLPTTYGRIHATCIYVHA